MLRTTIQDYAKFVVSVIHDEGLTKEIAAERATLTRDRMKPEDLKNVCSTSGEPGHCLVTAGMGLGWEVETVNGEKILDHDGSDWGVKTFVMFCTSTDCKSKWITSDLPVTRAQTGVSLFRRADFDIFSEVRCGRMSTAQCR